VALSATRAVERACIYNAYLPTLGGGELCTLAAASALAAQGWSVDVLSLPGTSLAEVTDRFGLPPHSRSVNLLELDPAAHGEEAAERSAEYDLFLNLTHDSRIPSRAVRALLWPWFPSELGDEPDDRAFVDSYDRVLAASHYVACWVHLRWGTEATVLHPPVLPVPDGPGRKERSIVVVARFQERPHPKRQLELVGAFGEARAAGELEGWTLDLVGGVQQQDEPYLEAVRAAARDLPVRLWVDAPRPVVEERLREAAIAWQATGWGCDTAREPQCFEHFGIGLVEAMTAGVVPVALRGGGAAEILRGGRDGVLWDPGPGPLPPTLALAADPRRLSELGAAARRRAGAFSLSAFETSFTRALNRA
jgi:glycosyltransferase involved in cell wall biosynthesis